nr:unnamed protein product [Naegleria fowleri]
MQGDDVNQTHHRDDDHQMDTNNTPIPTQKDEDDHNESLRSENSNNEQVIGNEEQIYYHHHHDEEEETSYQQQQQQQQDSSEGVRKGLFGRRAWDDQVYQQRAAERLVREKSGVDADDKRKVVQTRSESLQRKPLQARESRLLHLSDDKLIGKKGVIDVTPEGKQIMPNSKTVIKKKNAKEEMMQKVDPNQLAGFYCNVCDRSFKDSASFVDHCNSKSHLSRLGMTNRAVKASADEVKRKLQETIDAKKDEKGRAPSSVSSLTALALSRIKKNTEAKQK